MLNLNYDSENPLWAGNRTTALWLCRPPQAAARTDCATQSTIMIKCSQLGHIFYWFWQYLTQPGLKLTPQCKLGSRVHLSNTSMFPPNTLSCNAMSDSMCHLPDTECANRVVTPSVLNLKYLDELTNLYHLQVNGTLGDVSQKLGKDFEQFAYKPKRPLSHSISNK